jgi:molybdopterin-guanine dinucleotide biosynthesis protein A
MPKRLLCAGQPLGLIVLAGGSGRRMRRNKALLPVPGGTLIERLLNQLEGFFAETLISVSEEEPFRFLGRRLVSDEAPDLGPMHGICRCLSLTSREKNLVIACDIPDVDLDVLRAMCSAAETAEIVVPVADSGRREPLLAIYSRSLVGEMQRLLEAGERSLLPLLDRCSTRTLVLEDAGWLLNLNTERDYLDFLERLGR